MEKRGKGDTTRFFFNVETITPFILQEESGLDEDVNKLRKDGRMKNQMRSIFMKTGVISQASGSSYIEMNGTKVICGVYGPRQSPDFTANAIVSCEFKYSSFSKMDRRYGFRPENIEKEFSILIVQSTSVAIQLEKFPKSLIEINLLVLECDGGELGASITAASLALADAGISSYDLVAACTSGIYKDVVILDPTDDEKRNLVGTVTVSMMPSLENITQVIQTGNIPMNLIFDSIDLCSEGCKKIHAMMVEHLKSVTIKEFEKMKLEI